MNEELLLLDGYDCCRRGGYVNGKGVEYGRKTFKTRTKKSTVAIIREGEGLPVASCINLLTINSVFKRNKQWLDLEYYATLCKSRAADVIAGRVIRSGTSVGANCRAACRAKSTADMINKLEIV